MKRFLLKMLPLFLFFAVVAVIYMVGDGEKIRKKAEKEYTKELFAMNTCFTMKAYGSHAENALELAAERVKELEGLFSVTTEGSDVWRINHGESDDADDQGGFSYEPYETKTYTVSKDTYQLVSASLHLCSRTGGALDITMYPVLQLWGFTTGSYRVPTEEEICAALSNTGYPVVNLNGEGDKISLPVGRQLDFGAVAKGYAGDSILEILRANGVESAIIDLGGNVQTLGKKPDGTLWKVGIRNPFDPATEIGVLEVGQAAVVTSGNYERYFEMDGKRYGHILDSETGYPAESGLASVTVIGRSGITSDGYATAMFAMGMEKAIEFWRERQEFEMILVTEDGQVYITEGIEDKFQGAEGFPPQVIR